METYDDFMKERSILPEWPPSITPPASGLHSGVELVCPQPKRTGLIQAPTYNPSFTI